MGRPVGALVMSWMEGSVAVLANLELLRQRGIALFRKGLSIAARDALAEWKDAAVAARRVTVQIESLVASGANWFELQRPAEALSDFEAAHQLHVHSGEGGDEVLRPVLFHLALAHDVLGEGDLALDYATQAWNLAQGEAQAEFAAQVALLLGKLYIAQESWSHAYDFNARALQYFEGACDRHGISKALNNLGLVCVETGEYDLAAEHLNRALSIKQDLNDVNAVLYTLTELGRLHFERGDLAAAAHHGRTSLQILWENVALMDKAEVVRLCRLFGSIASHTGDRQGAMAYLQRATTYYAQGGLWREWSAANQELDALIKEGRTAAPSRVRIEWHDKEILRYLTTLLGLMDTMESLHPDLRGRSELVTKYALLLGEACGVGDVDRKNLSLAARLADIGLTSTEDSDGKAASAGHAVMGEKILSMFSVSEACQAAVRHHHEHYDGSGCPDGLAKSDIPLASRIIAVVDAYISLATTEPEARPHASSMATLHDLAGKRLDPALVELFAAMHDTVANDA